MNLFLIWNVERNMWWKDHREGYTQIIFQAGGYSWDEAFKICKGANLFKVEDIMVPLDFIPTIGDAAAEKMGRVDGV